MENLARKTEPEIKCPAYASKQCLRGELGYAPFEVHEQLKCGLLDGLNGCPFLKLPAKLRENDKRR